MDVRKRFVVIVANLFITTVILTFTVSFMCTVFPVIKNTLTYNEKLLHVVNCTDWKDITHAIHDNKLLTSCVNWKIVKDASIVEHLDFIAFLITMAILFIFITAVAIALDYKRWTLKDHKNKHEITSFRLRMAHSVLQFSLCSPLDLLCFNKMGRRLADVITGYDMIAPIEHRD